jgi:hypothetical protein
MERHESWPRGLPPCVWHTALEAGVFPTELSDTYPFASLPRHRNLLRSTSRRSRRRRQRRDPPQHAAN